MSFPRSFSDKIKQEDIKNLSTKLSETLETKSEESFSDFLQKQQSTNSQILLLQLPDTLPATISKDLAAMGQEKEQTETDVAENGLKQQPVNNFCTLQDLPEGQIGKLVRYKSGKMKLILGNGHLYDVTHGIDSSYLQVRLNFHQNGKGNSHFDKN